MSNGVVDESRGQMANPTKTALKKLTADRSTTELRWIFFLRDCGA
jgi:hypothetical protein